MNRVLVANIYTPFTDPDLLLLGCLFISILLFKYSWN